MSILKQQELMERMAAALERIADALESKTPQIEVKEKPKRASKREE